MSLKCLRILTALLLLSGCYSQSYKLQVVAAETDADQVTVTADVISVQDYWVDIACGKHKEQYQRTYDIKYARVASGSPRLIRILVGTQRIPGKRESYRRSVLDLDRPEVIGDTSDPAWQAAVGNAKSFLSSISVRVPSTRQLAQDAPNLSLIFVTEAHDWIVVLPQNYSGARDYTFAGTTYHYNVSGVVFGRKCLEGKAFLTASCGLRWVGVVFSAVSANGDLVLLYDDWNPSGIGVALPLAGKACTLSTPAREFWMTPHWNSVRGTISFRTPSRTPSTFDITEWDFLHNKQVHIIGDVDPLFHERGGTLVPN